MSIKFKQGESETVFYKIDTETGKKQSFLSTAKPKTSGFGMNKEMIEWVEAGSTIEPQYTTEELAEKKAKEATTAFEAMKATCVRCLNDSEIHVSIDPPYPDDVNAWVAVRAQWRTIIKGSVTTAIPPKPF